MQTELEVKFANINPHHIRRELERHGAKLVAPERFVFGPLPDWIKEKQ